ncbi:MAG: outer membrane protein [Flavobacteriales bacterium]|jgi:outer membrane protein
MNFTKYTLSLFVLAALLDGSFVRAESLGGKNSSPKVEVGVAVATQYLADYRGSGEYQSQFLPVPILLYNGDRFRIDRSGIHSDIFKRPRVELNISGEASLSGGEDNDLRAGMPELQSAFEIGPSLNVRLLGDSFEDGLSLRLPVRAVLALGSNGGEAIGYLANPKLTYRNHNVGNNWRFTSNLGFTAASGDYHQYYYSVEQQYETSTRASYDARAGFSGWYSKAGVSRRRGSWFVSASLRYDNLNGANFKDSPLVETDNYFSVSLAVAKFLWSK